MVHRSLLANRGFLIAEGILLILLGILAILWPGVFTKGIDILIGWVLIVSAVVQGFRAYSFYPFKGYIPTLVSAVIYCICGILLLHFPQKGIASLTFLLTLFFLFDGVAKLVLAFRLRPLQRWIWFAIGGVLEIAMAVIILSNWQTASHWVLGLLAGINLLFLGGALLGLTAALPKDSQ